MDKDVIYRQDAIDALDEIESEVADGDGFQYEKWRKHFCEMTSARPDHIADGNKKGDTINRKSAIEALHDEIVSRRIDEDTNDDGALDEFDTEAILRRLPSAQPEPIWGLPVSADRPLADVEIVSRLRDIQKQIPGASYAIDRAIEIIEAVAERREE